MLPILGLSSLRLVQVCVFQVQLGQFRLSQVRLGQVRLGQVRLTKITLRQIRVGYAEFFTQLACPLRDVFFTVGISKLSHNKHWVSSLAMAPFSSGTPVVLASSSLPPPPLSGVTFFPASLISIKHLHRPETKVFNENMDFCNSFSVQSLKWQS